MKNEKFFLGLDIGTNSVGWAVTDDEYKLRKFKNDLMWGVHLFDEAQQSADRRSFRTARRRLDRCKQRISILQDFFAAHILELDKSFFVRLKESALLPQDSEHRTSNIFFDDESFVDKDYFDKYPTIHHLINDLMCSPDPHDVRLVYLACAYILSHRGHFLFEVEKDDIKGIVAFLPLFNEFMSALHEMIDEIPFDSNSNELEQILKARSGVTEKEKRLTESWFGGKKPSKDLCESLRFDLLIKLMSGGKVTLAELFRNDEYKELETPSVSVASVDFADTLDALASVLSLEQTALLSAAKKLNDWSLLVNILKNSDSISQSKIKEYETHKQDLEKLKKLCRNYMSKADYNSIFRDEDEKNKSYNAYINSPRNCSQEDFCKFVKSYIDKIECKENDRDTFDYINKKCENKTLCPKQVNTDNRVIPYQLYYHELKCILDNACMYLDFLNEKDKYGTIADKILSIMEFRIPYFVGPLVTSGKSKFAWMQRKAEGKIYPWNFAEKVDLDKSENEFIRRMTCKCTYLAGEDVLPKNSLLYCKFEVLNEINNLTVDGDKISVQSKQKIFRELFEKKRRVTVKMIADLLLSCGEMKPEQKLGGVDVTIKSSLKSYHDFKHMLAGGVLAECDAEKIIERITVTTDKTRFKKWLKDEYSSLAEDDVKYISKLSYKDYGRLSRRLLENVLETDTNTGELVSENNIITRLWETNDNLMQLLSSKYKYMQRINALNVEFYCDPARRLGISERLKEMYVPTAVRRSINRTVDIVKEIKSIIGRDPDKIFIEMARENDVSQKGKRTKSRREQITELFKSVKEIIDAQKLSELEQQLESTDDGRLRSEKYYLYFTQLGRCMYTGHTIEFDKLGSDTFYNVDHIWPQAKIKDDSLENKVLVETEANGEKGDSYPIKNDIRAKMYGFWHSLHEKNLIGDKKYQRLTRSSSFTEEELSGFIARQLVETRQSTKAVSEILKELCPDSDLVYVKAELASDFRKEIKMLKCREINDLHHAKDAYLNIVMGNVYNTKFTNDPLNFIRKGERYSLKMFKENADGKSSGLMTNKVERSGVTAWDPKSSFDIVRKMMAKNSIRYVRYTYKRKGGLFDIMPLKKKDGLVSRKKDLDPELYGGYNKKTASFFTLIKAKEDIIIVSVDLMNVNAFLNNDFHAKKLAYEALKSFYSGKKLEKISADDIEFPIGKRLLKINTMLELDGYRVNVCSKDSGGQYISVSSAIPLVLSISDEQYIKKIESFCSKKKTDKTLKVSEISGISKTDNLKVYDMIAKKCLTAPFSKWVKFREAGKILENGRTSFSDKELTEQTVDLMKALSVLKTGRVANCDFKFVGGVGAFNTVRLNSVLNLTGYQSIRIIDQSPTGLFEKKSVNLLEL